MDKNTIIGMLLIIAIMFGFYKYNEPSREKQAQMYALQQAKRDSIAQAQSLSLQRQKLEELKNSGHADEGTSLDSVELIQKRNELGSLYSASEGTKKIYTLENKNLRVKISSKGAQIVSVELKQYKKYNGEPLVLFDSTDSKFSFLFNANNRLVQSSSLYFTSNSELLVDASSDSQSIIFTLNSGGDPVQVIYSLNPDSYKVDYLLSGTGLANVFARNTTSIILDWTQKMSQIEKGRSFEERYTKASFKYANENSVNQLGSGKSEEETLETKVDWISFNDQFFSSFLRAGDNGFQSGTLKSKKYESGSYLKDLSSEMVLPYVPGRDVNLEFYYLPNKLKILKAQGSDLKFDGVVYMGWGIFGWINKFLIVKIFNFLENFFVNYGLIILILTIIIKLIIFPFTYKSYLSTAKMRLLKPEMDEINEKIPDTKPLERQKAMSALQKKAGVSPLGGCLPMLFQMPILFAMYSFFPVSFELRQQSFLWAKDLSSYDSFITWATPIPILGNHLSLFCLLMTVTNIVYTWINASTTNQQMNTMPMMKYMMYFMPIIFFFVLNDYASGLSYYYFVSTLITIIQTIGMRYMVDEGKLLAQIEANKNKKGTQKKKSGFQARLEKIQREQQKAAKNRRR